MITKKLPYAALLCIGLTMGSLADAANAEVTCTEQHEKDIRLPAKLLSQSINTAVATRYNLGDEELQHLCDRVNTENQQKIINKIYKDKGIQVAWKKYAAQRAKCGSFKESLGYKTDLRDYLKVGTRIWKACSLGDAGITIPDNLLPGAGNECSVEGEKKAKEEAARLTLTYRSVFLTAVSSSEDLQNRCTNKDFDSLVDALRIEKMVGDAYLHAMIKSADNRYNKLIAVSNVTKPKTQYKSNNKMIDIERADLELRGCKLTGLDELALTGAEDGCDYYLKRNPK